MKTRDVPLRPVPEDGKLKPLFAIESRPSEFLGISWWAVLTYKDFHAEEMLPPNFMGLDEVGQNLALAPVAERLRQRLAPILIAEDTEGLGRGTDAALSHQSGRGLGEPAVREVEEPDSKPLPPDLLAGDELGEAEDYGE